MKRNTLLFLGALVVTAAVATVVAQFASDQPDGLEYVAEQQGFAETAGDHTLAESPLAGYGENLGGDSFVNLALAGAVGVALTLALGAALFWLVRTKPGRDEATES